MQHLNFPEHSVCFNDSFFWFCSMDFNGGLFGAIFDRGNSLVASFSNRFHHWSPCSPHWRVGFLFLVLYPLLVVLLLPVLLPVLPPSHSLTHSHSLTPSLPHSLTLTHSLPPSLPHSLTPSLTSLTPSLTHSLTHSLPHSLTHSLVSGSFAWQAWDNVHCQGVGCTPRGSAGVPWSPPLLRGRRGTMCTAKGSDVRPGVSLASLGLRLFCVAGVGQCALSRGRMYAPGFRWRPLVSTSFAWQAWDNVHCQGVGCTPRGSAGVPGSPPLTHWLTHWFIHSLTHSLTHSLHPSLTHSLTHSLPHSIDGEINR